MDFPPDPHYTRKNNVYSTYISLIRFLTFSGKLLSNLIQNLDGFGMRLRLNLDV